MGWNCKIISNYIIREEDVQNIINKVPVKYLNAFIRDNANYWGWSCICDVHKPVGHELEISGAYWSVDSTEKRDDITEFVFLIQTELNKLGYKTIIIWDEENLSKRSISVNPEKIMKQDIFYNEEDQQYHIIPDGDIATHKQIHEYYN